MNTTGVSFRLAVCALLVTICSCDDPGKDQSWVVIDTGIDVKSITGITSPAPGVVLLRGRTNDPTIPLFVEGRPSVLVSHDYGRNWLHVDVMPITLVGFDEFYPINANLVYASATKGFDHWVERWAVVKSVDQGRTWTEVEVINEEGPTMGDMHFWNETSGILFSRSVVYETSDGAKTWQLRETKGIPLPAYVSPLFLNDQTGFVHSDRYNSTTIYSVLARTTDGGHTWEDISASVASVPALIMSKARIGNQGIALFTADYKMYLSKDAGTTWTLVSDELPVVANDAHFFTETHGYIGGQVRATEGIDGGIYSTEDGGKTWKREFATQSPNAFVGFAFDNTGEGFAVTSEGTVLRMVRR